MTTAIETLQNELKEMKKDLKFVRHLLQEEYELSEDAKLQLKEARKTSHEEYVDL